MPAYNFFWDCSYNNISTSVSFPRMDSATFNIYIFLITIVCVCVHAHTHTQLWFKKF